MATACRAVLFDAGQTLVRVEPSVGAVYADEAGRHGVTVRAALLDAAFRAAWERHGRQPGAGLPLATSEEAERAWWRGVVWGTFAEAGAATRFSGRFDAFFADLYERFARAEAWRVYEDVVPALDALRAHGVACAVVSNWDSRLPRLLQALGLARHFAAIVTSAEAGWAKPDPRIFAVALDRLRAPPAETVHVGDSYAHDVVGARQAGIWPVLLDRPGRFAGDCPCVTSLRELPERLAREGLW